MGIESDRLVYNYLSRVGDLAQRQLPSGERMRLVSELRTRIDTGRSAQGADTPATVRRILDRIGTPDEVVAAHTPAPATAPAPDPSPAPPPSVPQQRAPAPSRASATDWWRVEQDDLGGADQVPGFVGGIEIPELRRGGPLAADLRKEPEKPAAPEAKAPPRTGLRRLLRPPAPAPVPVVAAPVAVAVRPGLSNPLLLLAAALLVAGAVLGSLLPLALGWGVVYLSRRLTRGEAKAAVLGIPGAVALAGGVWLWGRTEGRWGERLPADGMGDALSEAWPWALRGAAVASALFVFWRSQRPRG